MKNKNEITIDPYRKTVRILVKSRNRIADDTHSYINLRVSRLNRV